MITAETCARCGGHMDEPLDSVAPPSALFGDLCLGCLDAVWDAVMGGVIARRTSAPQANNPPTQPSI